MTEPKADPQDPIIRAVLLSAAAVAILGMISTVLLVTAMISANFNFLNWME
jgi:hypothetical protein